MDLQIHKDCVLVHLEPGQLYVLQLPAYVGSADAYWLTERLREQVHEVAEEQRPVLVVMNGEGYDLARIGEGEEP